MTATFKNHSLDHGNGKIKKITSDFLPGDGDYFRLEDSFIKRYEDRRPNFGFNGLGEFVFYRTYSRLKANGTKESFLDCLRRVVEGCYEIQRRYCRRIHIPWDYEKALPSAYEMFERMWDFKFLPPGRGLWCMGTDFMWERGSAALNNCAFCSTEDISIDPAEPFCFLMDMSMLGVGVGFDTCGAGQVTIRRPNRLQTRRFQIPDSREGWVESVRLIIDSYTKNPDAGRVELDYSLVRPAGIPIKGFGGVASGPENLRRLHEMMRDFLDGRVGRTLSSRDIVDLMNMIGVCVVAGNVRRSSEIAFGDVDDLEYMTMKNPVHGLNTDQAATFFNVADYFFNTKQYKIDSYQFNEVLSQMRTGHPDMDRSLLTHDKQLINLPKPIAPPGAKLIDIDESLLSRAIEVWNAMNQHRWASNNAIRAKVGMDYTAPATSTGQNGEPGYAWLENMRDFGRMIDGRQPGIDGRAKGGNPCLEQTLESYELCVGGDTRIQTRTGCQPIQSLVGKAVEIWNGDRWSLVTPRVTGHGRKLCRVYLSDGSYLDCTDNHGWHVQPSHSKHYRRVETKDLQPGQRSVPFSINETIGRHEPYAFEYGLFVGDGYIDQGGRYPMVCICGDKVKLKDLGVHGVWYKPQIKEGYKEPYNRLNLNGFLDMELARQLNDKVTGLPDTVFEWDRESILQFVAGWIETDGNLAEQPGSDAYRIFGAESAIRDLQLLLRRVGIDHASVYNAGEEGDEIKQFGTTRRRDVWCCRIPSYECAEIPTRIKVAKNFGRRFKDNPLYGADTKQIDMARRQSVERVEELHGDHTTYCFNEPENHMGVFGNVLTYQCCLVESFPANHRDADDYLRTLKFAYLYAKTVTLLPTHNARTNSVMQRNRRIGLSQSGIVQAFEKFGRRTVLRDFCDAGYHEIRRWDNIYSDWLCIGRSIKVTSVKPSGTVSLVAGATPGIHYPEAKVYWRRVRIGKNSPLVQIAREACYHVEDAYNDPMTAVITFGIDESRVPSVDEVPMWQQVINAVDYQRYWADNQVSCTVKFQPHERSQIKPALESFEDQLKGLSFCPHTAHGYKQAPYEPCNAEEVAAYNAKVKPIDFRAWINEDALGSKFCDNDSCVLMPDK